MIFLSRCLDISKFRLGPATPFIKQCLCAAGLYLAGVETRDLCSHWEDFQSGDSKYSGLARLTIRLGRTLRENDNDRQWKLLLPIMPTLLSTHQTVLSDSVCPASQQLSYNHKPEDLTNSGLFSIINPLYRSDRMGSSSYTWFLTRQSTSIQY